MFKYVFIFLTFFLLCFPDVPRSYAESIRKPVWAGRFYPDSKIELEKQIHKLTQAANKTRFQPPAGKRLKAIIMPHAGYIYSGLTAAHASLVLNKNTFNKVILLAPDHRIGFEDCAVSNVNAYQTPLGLIQLHQDAHKLRSKSPLFKSVPASDRSEHSLEVILPFLQHYLTAFELVPIVVGYPRNIDLITSAIQSIIDNQTLLVISSDLSHFLPYKDAVHKDMETIDMILNKKAAELSKSRLRACGIMPIAILLKLAITNNWRPVLIHYSNSGDTAGDKSKVVGYAAIAFYEDTHEDTQNPLQKGQTLNIKQEHGQVLVQLAKHTIMKYLDMKIKKTETASLNSALKNDIFQTQRGTFVTLSINGMLRGCIGNITPHGAIGESVKRNAISAAFHDPRFEPLTLKEFKNIHIEVSVLTDPKPLKYKNSTELISKLRPNIDGVIIKKDMASATFLPQVWRQLPNPEIFLSHLCRKAGLQPNAWQKSPLDVLIYQVQYFEE
ncbi:MAG: AmmeMemoRadiSam system protein B [Deltaproteobacteria bacterium]|nr:AmmeMemoRadiSam system protein B [Deltaproteobacteria bacterium]